MIRLAIALLTPLPLIACATESIPAPSLLPRAIETRSDAEPSRPLPAATQDAALDTQIAQLEARRKKASDEFADADRTATARLAAGARASVGSDAWLDAQTALAALDAPRAELLSVLTELEQMASARVAAGQPPYPALDAARIDADAELDRVTAIIAERRSRLPI